ncbi:plasmid partitioning protein RepB [Planktotalea sp.]|uniref:plasmid partitioning protein RepB n=1 Tax=Planktotalea sp. TaxID=2029877 RepID=UPI003298FA88
MSDSKKKRMAMLDTLAAAGSPAPPPSMAASRPLRAARNAVDSHKVWDLDPNQIIDERFTDRLDLTDVDDLRDSIEATGQTVPILVRRHPKNADQYLLVYGRRRLEAIRRSDSVQTIKALIANLDQDHAIEAQISENMARRDLSYIEKALFAHELIEGGFGNQTRVAEVLTVTKSSISMALGIIGAIGPDLVRIIGPAHAIGRPRWDALANAVEASRLTPDALMAIAGKAEDAYSIASFSDNPGQSDRSVEIFEAVWDAVAPAAPSKPKRVKPKQQKGRTLTAAGKPTGTLSKTASGLKLELQSGAFADWLEDQMQVVLDELHERFEQRRED